MKAEEADDGLCEEHVEGAGDGGGDEKAYVLEWGALGFGGPGDVEVGGALVEYSWFVGFAHEEGEGEEDDGEE